jgi:2-polyprenyl-3-methyl-5-hydroxy-6-metoxy-1,4-benzoquinol methylase
MNNEVCLLCESSDVKFYEKIGNYTLLKCNSCGLLFTSQNFEQNRKFINNQIYSHNYLNNYDSRENILIDRFREKVLRIEKYKQGGKLLDFGCSTGLFLKAVKKFNNFSWKLAGVDINSLSVEIAKKNKQPAYYIKRDITELNFQKKSIDVITCFDVLEHDQNILQTLSHFSTFLTKSGILVIQSPNYYSFMRIFCGKYWDWWSVPDHVFHFSFDYLKSLVEAQGFKVIYQTTWEPREDFINNIKGNIRKNKRTFIRRLIAKFIGPILFLLWYILYPIKRQFNLGGLTFIIAQKI